MDFNSETFEPLYRIIIGMPGSSNAIEISKHVSDNYVSDEEIINEVKKNYKLRTTDKINDALYYYTEKCLGYR